VAREVDRHGSLSGEAKRLDEFASIRHWTEGRQSAEWLEQQGVITGIGDDAAVVETLSTGTNVFDSLLTVDTMVETIHFNSVTMAEEEIGWKALAANVSDIAAMGGIPKHALVSVSVPKAWGPERIRRVYDGLYACAEHYGVAVIGGDTTSAPAQLVVSVTLIGAIEHGRAITRSGAKPGDVVFVTGLPGMSAAGLHWLLANARSAETGKAGDTTGPYIALSEAQAAGTAALVQAHRQPKPSVEAARLLAERCRVTALNDISDGLASEAWEIAQASGVSLLLRASQLPISGTLAAYASRMELSPYEWILYGGEDYVLLGTIAAEDAARAKALLNKEGLPMYLIGTVEEIAENGEPRVELLHEGEHLGRGAFAKPSQRERLSARGYNHFALGGVT